MHMTFEEVSALPRLTERGSKKYWDVYGNLIWSFPDDYMGEVKKPGGKVRTVSSGWYSEGLLVYQHYDGWLYAVEAEIFTGCSG